ncbi:hypothetical protein [Streptomyces sp. NPDC058294]|uniref:hypothetical protein n=1 Tax=Streptomyces sp. NPDC058294 TaxID=3346430 RepID=UPI0036EEF628
MRVLVLALGAGVAAVLWWRYRYPGGWAFAFGQAYRAERQDLARARRNARRVAGEHSRREVAARARLDAARTERRQRVRRAEREVAALRDPGAGSRLGHLGDLTLHEHGLRIASATGFRTVALAGLQVRLEAGRRNDSLYLAQPDGLVDRITYPHPAQTPEGESRGFDEDVVRDFVVRIHNAVADEDLFRAGLPDRLAQAQAGLEDAEEDTAAEEEAHANLNRIREEHSRDPRRANATAEREASRKRWHTLTGHYPPL